MKHEDYTYSATGQKLAVGHFVALPNVTWEFGVKPNTSNHTAIFAGHTDYLLGGSLIVQEGTTRMLLFDGGYAKAERTSPTSATYGYTLFYYTQDHLGNNREVLNSQGEVPQRTNYYPFGGIITDTSGDQDIQPYKYNGKELDRMHGLDTYDYGARQYYSILGRWDRMDPLCEKYYSLSPYNYCGGNPINAIDLFGKDILPVSYSRTNESGHAIGRCYYSFTNYMAAMDKVGQTSYGKEFIGSFLKVGESQYNVCGNGRNSQYTLQIEEYKISDNNGNATNSTYMGDNWGRLNIKEKKGKLFVVMQLDCDRSIDEIAETINHEISLHGYKLQEVFNAYERGGYEAARLVFDTPSENTEHKDCNLSKPKYGGALYNQTKKELENL